MRMSRKRRRRLEKEPEPIEREVPAFRMSRKRRKRLKKVAEPMLCEVSSFRMDRKRLREWRESRRPSPAGAFSLSALMLFFSGLTEASSLSTMHEVPGEFQSLRNAREVIINYRAAQKSLKDAQDNLAEAERALETARHDSEEANKGLLRARLNLEAAKANLDNLRESLAAAQAESEQRTQEALASQQAVADYLPNIYAQEASIQQLSDEAESLAGQYVSGYEAVSVQVDELAARIEQAWESVDWQQNRIAEVQAMVASAGSVAGADTPQVDNSAAYQSRLEEISDEMDRENAFLDEMYAYLDELQAAQDRAEDAEQEIRDLVADLTEQQAEASADLEQSKTDLAETEKWQEEAEKENIRAEKERESADKDLAQARHDLEHFGESSASESRVEYYSWRGPEHGHQLIFEQEFYSSTKKYEYGGKMGYALSESGHKDGNSHYAGLTDTQLSFTWKNDHPINDVHYVFSLNVPTARTSHVNAQVMEGLAKYTSFNNGWIFTPAVEVKHKFSEKESLTGRLSYSFRGGYDVRSTGADGSSVEEHISPGNQLTPELIYQYAGEKNQHTVKLGYVHNGGTSQSGSSATEYRDGNSFWLRWFYNHELTPADSLQVYASYQREGKAHFYDNSVRPYNSNLTWHEFGIGWRHKFDDRQYLQLMLNYQKAHGNLYRYSTRGSESEDNYLFSPRRLSVLLAYGYKLSDRGNLELKLERYNIKEEKHRGYNGWGMALMYNYSF